MTKRVLKPSDPWDKSFTVNGSQVVFEHYLCFCNEHSGSRNYFHRDCSGTVCAFAQKDYNGKPSNPCYCEYINMARIKNHPYFQAWKDKVNWVTMRNYRKLAPVYEIETQLKSMKIVKKLNDKKTFTWADFKNEKEIVLCLSAIFITDEAGIYIEKSILDNLAFLHALFNKFYW